MGSSLLAHLPVDDVREFAQHALSVGVSEDMVVDELVHIARDSGILRKIPAPWRALAEDAAGGILRVVIHLIVREVAERLDAARRGVAA